MYEVRTRDNAIRIRTCLKENASQNATAECSLIKMLEHRM